MVGTKKSGNPYAWGVTPPAPLGVFIDFIIGQSQQGKGMWTLNLILRVYAKEAEEFFKKYPELLEKYRKEYGVNIMDITIANEIKQKEKEAKEARELAVAEKNAQSFEKEIILAEKKSEVPPTPEPTEEEKLAEKTKKIKELEKDVQMGTDYIEKHPDASLEFIEKVEAKKKELEAQLSN